MMIPMRVPVTSTRRCVQITALGASVVPDVKCPVGRLAGEEQVRPPTSLSDVLAMRPDAVTELDRGTTADARVARVAPEDLRRIGGRHRRLARRGDGAVAQLLG